MAGLEKGATEGSAGTTTSATAAPSNNGMGADTLPLNVPAATVQQDDKAAKDAAEQKARDIFRKLNSEDTEEDPDAAAAELEEDTGTGEEGAGKSEAEKPAPKSSTAAADEEEAHKALVRDGWSDDDLKKLPPERVLELGAKARARQQAGDRFGSQKAQEIAQLKAKLAELEGTPANNPPAQQQQQPPAQQADASPELPKAVKEELAKLGELASPEAQTVLEKAFGNLYAAAAANAQAQAQAAQQQLAAITRATEQQLVSAARKAVSEEFPDLKDDAKFGEVMKKATAFAKSGFYGPGDMEQLVRDAARTMFQPTIKDVQRKMLERTKKAKDGQPDVGQQAPTVKALTPEEQSRAILKAMQQGKSAQAARRTVLSK